VATEALIVSTKSVSHRSGVYNHVYLLLHTQLQTHFSPEPLLKLEVYTKICSYG